MHLDALGLSDGVRDAYREAFDAYEGSLNRTAHLLGGHPTPIQSPMEAEAALVSHGAYMGGDKPSGLPESECAAIAATASEYQLLLQLDSDELMNAAWGDSGRLYFLATARALRARDFEQTWCILQCY